MTAEHKQREREHRRALLALIDAAEAAGMPAAGLLALVRLAQNPRDSVAAVTAIRACISIGLAIPSVLHPWISRALDAYAEQSPLKGTQCAQATREKREQVVRLIVHLMSYEGLTRGRAIQQAAQMTGYTEDTLLEYYKDAAELRRELWDYAKAHPVETFTAPLGLDMTTQHTVTRKRARVEPLGERKRSATFPSIASLQVLTCASHQATRGTHLCKPTCATPQSRLTLTLIPTS
ncbi:MAG: hypothetical protein ACLFQ1_02200 [Halochromatium sp.]